jgi:hypothetical protein
MKVHKGKLHTRAPSTDTESVPGTVREIAREEGRNIKQRMNDGCTLLAALFQVSGRTSRGRAP